MRFRPLATRSLLAFLVASVLALPALASPEPKRRPDAARAAYERATRMRTTLMSQPEGARKKSDYEEVIRQFKSVHFHDPTYVKSPMALEAVAELYAEMGRRFKSEAYYGTAIKSYQYLQKHYPQSNMARDAQFAVAEIYKSDLGRSEDARKAFEEYLKKNPRSAKAGEARTKLKEIDKSVAEAQVAATKGVPPPATVFTRGPGLPEVTGIRRWVGPNYTRIVINVEGEVKFESSRVPNPDRIVLDLQDAKLSSALVGKTFPVENGFLQQVRIGQYQPRVTRVVLDVAKIEEYSVFTLPNPFRLVVDINGPPLPETKEDVAATSEPRPSKPAEIREASTAAPGAVTRKPSPPGSEASVAAKRESPPPATVEPSEEKLQRTGNTTSTAVKLDPAPAVNPEPSAAKREPAATGKPGIASPTKAPSPTATGSRTLTRALGLKIARIVIDPGHGGHDTGTIGPTGLREKDLVLDVARRLKLLLEERTGAEVLMTRSDDTFIPLEERTAIANEKGADLFISIHANASRDRRARGIETYFLNFTSDSEALELAGRENATSQESVHQLQDLIKKIALTEKIEESQDFATQVQREVHTQLKKLTGEQKNRGVKKAPFVVLIGANMPSILAEISFLTNPKDEKLLKKSDHRNHIAEALHRGISRYADNLGGVKVTEQAANSPGTKTNLEPRGAGASNF